MKTPRQPLCICISCPRPLTILVALLACFTLPLRATAFAPKYGLNANRYRIASQRGIRVSPVHRSVPTRRHLYKASGDSEHETVLRITTESNSEDGFIESKPPPFSVTLEGEDYSYEQAVQRTLGWVGAATIFGGALWALFGSVTGEEYFAGYLVEQSLSIDNLFVFLLLFEYFKVPLAYQDRVLNWGIYGAVVMRAVMIGLGSAALQNFHGILLVFAAILVYSSAQFFIGEGGEEEEDPVDGVRYATPLLICLITVEISDVVFAVDSIPAVFGVTENPLVVFSSNIFAIMGLRSIYTILSKAATDLKYLEPAVALVLGFIGAKMIAEYFGYSIPTSFALGVVATVLGTGIGASVWDKQKQLDSVDE